jgi:hypothetical protein
VKVGDEIFGMRKIVIDNLLFPLRVVGVEKFAAIPLLGSDVLRRVSSWRYVSQALLLGSNPPRIIIFQLRVIPHGILPWILHYLLSLPAKIKQRRRTLSCSAWSVDAIAATDVEWKKVMARLAMFVTEVVTVKCFHFGDAFIFFIVAIAIGARWASGHVEDCAPYTVPDFLLDEIDLIASLV